MNRRPHKAKNKNTERYDENRSPLAQKPTQKQLASLLRITKSELRSLATHKDLFIVRRSIVSGKKTRNLAYPTKQLRTVHERLKFQCSKIKLPEYIYSPRKFRSQRLNAALHAGHRQYLKLDIKQFYPSTSREHIYKWARHRMRMLDDVAGLFCELVTVDDVVSFGSPLTPVLTTLIHREMFDEIAEECRRRGLRFSIWVDDLTISGNFVPGLLLSRLRQIIRSYGMRSHKIEYKTGSRAVIITGVPIRGGSVLAPFSVDHRVSDGYKKVIFGPERHREKSSNELLSSLGTYRFHVGPSSVAGQKAANRMAGLRQRIGKTLAAETERLGLSWTESDGESYSGPPPF